MRLSHRGASAYHVQQAAEKLVKGLLSSPEARLVAIYPRFAPQAEAVRHLSIWGVAYRYPGLEEAPEPLPAIEDLDKDNRYAEGVRGPGG